MLRRIPDQAEGLRRLFVGDVRRMVALVGGADTEAARVLSVRVADALLRQEKKVLLLNEACAAGERPPGHDAVFKQDLHAVLKGRADMEQVLVPVAPRLDLLAGGGSAALSSQPTMEARIGLVNEFYRLTGRYDVVLVDAIGTDVSRRANFAWACQDVVVLCGDHAGSVTEAYAHIKNLHQAGERHFHLLFQGMDEMRAQALHRSIAAVCRRHLHLMPDFLGTLDETDAGFFAQFAGHVLNWPLPENKTGHFPALMRRLLRNPAPSAMAVAR